MANEPKIGHILPDQKSADRDAIHIAVAPVIAFEELRPGQHVGFIEKGNTELVGPNSSSLIGIVDPYLDQIVHPGEACWLFLYPQTITSLRHNWTHPAFGEQKKEIISENIKLSKQWLKNFLRNNGPDYDDFIEAVNNGGEFVNDSDSYYSVRIEDDYIYVNGTDAHGNIPDEFWDHVEVVTGRKQLTRPSHFSCSC